MRLLPSSASSLLAAVFASSAAAATYGENAWPELTMLPATGAGSRDVAVIIGVESYEHHPVLRGATQAARQWRGHLQRTHGIPSEQVSLLTGDHATADAMLAAVQQAAAQAPEGGHLWLVFIGRGALTADDGDALMLGTDADPGADDPSDQGLSLSAVMSALGAGAQRRSLLVLDTAFVRSELFADGGSEPVVIRPSAAFQSRGSATALLASNNGAPLEYLPDLPQPPFSYLLLGAMRGWADADDNHKITASEALDYVQSVLHVASPQQQELPAAWGTVEGLVISESREFAPELSEVLWRSAQRRIENRVHELAEAEQMLRAEATAVWQAVLGAHGLGGQDAMASVQAFAQRWRAAHVQVDKMRRWVLVPELAEAQAMLDLAKARPLGQPSERTVEGERYVQLAEEIRQFVRRSAWKGVEATYQELLRLRDHGVPIRSEDHLNGARAARQLGNAAGVHHRLRLSVDVSPNEEAIQWLNDWEQSYGQVRLQNLQRDPVALLPASMPFAPDRRAAVLKAQERIEDSGQFEGMLPAGVYDFGGELLVVAPGDPAIDLTLQRKRRNGD